MYGAAMILGKLEEFWNFSDFVRISVIFIRAEELG